MNVALASDQRDGMLMALERAKAKALRDRQRLFHHLFPDEDTPTPTWCEQIETPVIYAREKYPKHLEFFRAGAMYRERCARCANRVGKTFGMGGYEMACHLTGLYPDWWEGRRFDRPIRAWAAGKNNETVRDILQVAMLGNVTRSGGRKGVDGTGVIPGEKLLGVIWRSGVTNVVDKVEVRHISGRKSTLGFKSYEQGSDSFMGTAQHFILLDEEPPKAIYEECLMRLMTTKGLLALTFTPLLGLSEVVLQFMPRDQRPGGGGE